MTPEGEPDVGYDDIAYYLDVAARADADASDRAAMRRQHLRAATVRAVRAGMSEVEAARRAGVTRATVRAWLGKKR